MLQNLKASFALSASVAKKIKTHDRCELELLKERLLEGIDITAEWYKIVLPIVFSMSFTLFSVAISQGFLWVSIAEWLAWSGHSVVIGMLAGALVFCVIFIPQIMLIGHGYYFALRLHVLIIFLVALGAVLYFVASYIPLLTGGESNDWNTIGSVLSLIFSALSITCLNSLWFVKATAIGLHNRISRELSRRQKHTQSVIKR